MILRRLAGNLTLLAAAAACFWGCQSPKPKPSPRLAFVIVENRTTEQVTIATKAVFQGAAYEPGRADKDELVFERPGTAMNTLAYGDWYGSRVWERVKVYQRELAPGRTLVDCDLYMVQDHDDPFFQKERKVSRRKTYYQDLLDQVVKRLDTDPGEAP